MKENKYDDPEFFLTYSRMPRSVNGLAAAGEWSTLRSMLPDLHDKTVLDLGCGYGWHCRYAREAGAAKVTGIDISAMMLEQARATTQDPAIDYKQMAIEDIDFAPATFDLVFSSLALHYVQPYAAVCNKIHSMLKPGGSFVFSVEHPVFTAIDAQDWYLDDKGNRLHWPVDNYQDESIRHTNFLGHQVIKYHRTFSTWLNALISAGFSITRIGEPAPNAQTLKQYPEMKDEVRRPIFLLIAATKE
ncbi:MAG: class I SAM-dependent methyltransferase [Chitinophagaceae bacterium]|nr:class I SAM-dependent methyltransferase [Chitinophagaceae bacterium]